MTNLDREVVGAIRGGMVANGLNLDNLAVACEMNPRTLRRRMAEPETFSVGELRSICRRLHITMSLGG